MNDNFWRAQTRQIVIYKYQRACVYLGQETWDLGGWMDGEKKKLQISPTLWETKKKKKCIIVQCSG